jgi:hypothetical protein
MRKLRIKLLINKYIITVIWMLKRNKDILAKQNFMIKYFF